MDCYWKGQGSSLNLTGLVSQELKVVIRTAMIKSNMLHSAVQINYMSFIYFTLRKCQFNLVPQEGKTVTVSLT